MNRSRIILALVLVAAACHGCASEPAPLSLELRDELDRQHRLMERRQRRLPRLVTA